MRTCVAAGIVAWTIAIAKGQTDAAQNPPAEDLSSFTRAITEGRLVGPGNAFELLQKMRGVLPSDDWDDQKIRLLDELTRRASQVVTNYTSGDEVPQTKDDYEHCAAWYDAAGQLESASKSDQSRMWFCRGRSLLEPGPLRNFDLAEEYLKKAIELAPEGNGAYHYNALGVVYLEEGLTDQALNEFDQAIRHETSPWTYPEHDLALTYIEKGDYVEAENIYRNAIDKADKLEKTGYLHYNLGLLEHQLGQKKEAHQEYDTALKIFLDQMAEEEARNATDRAARFKQNAAWAYNAIGALCKSEGKSKEAEQAYLNSLKMNPDLPAAQRNLELLRGRIRKAAKAGN
jgi:tetratricopeptide (TPR) repeat protein